MPNPPDASRRPASPPGPPPRDHALTAFAVILVLAVIALLIAITVNDFDQFG